MSDTQDKLAALRKRTLLRDDTTDPDGRIYKNLETGEIYHSVTRILQSTMDPEAKKRLDSWLQRPTSHQDRNMAAARGTLAHGSAEYCLKLGQRLARKAANNRNSWKMGEDGLYRAPKAITKWALEKSVSSAPKVSWSASGFARGLRGWILDHVTNIHAVEFSGYHPAGFAGSADAFLDIAGTKNVIVDFKTTGKSLHADMEAQTINYRDQLGGYSLMLTYLTGIEANAGAIVTARRSGAPVTTLLDRTELSKAEGRYLARCERHFNTLNADRSLIDESEAL